jgi:Uma2 family endonuclease
MTVAMPIISTTKMTADQYMKLGDDPPGVRLELVEGEIAVSPSATPKHSHAVVQLILILGQYIRAHKMGELFQDVDTVLDRFNVRRPDILYFSAARAHLIGEKSMQGPPDLAIEVISPSSVQVDRTDKFAQYAEAGIAHYWLVDPDARTIEACQLQQGVYASSGRGHDEDVMNLPPFVDLAIPLSQLCR